MSSYTISSYRILYALSGETWLARYKKKTLKKTRLKALTIPE